MDLNYLHLLVTAARDEGDDGPAYDALVAYLDEQAAGRFAATDASPAAVADFIIEIDLLRARQLAMRELRKLVR